MIRAATKTEYRGHVFDSKSEAVLARILDLKVGSKMKISDEEPEAELVHAFYHPKIAGRVWDFQLVFRYRKEDLLFDFSSGGRFSLSGVGYVSVFVEYKPAAPTDSYLDQLERAVSLEFSGHSGQYGDLHPKAPIVLNGYPYGFAQFQVWFGSFFDRSGSFYGLDRLELNFSPPRPSWWSSRPIEIAALDLAEARQYRFDLVNGGSK